MTILVKNFLFGTTNTIIWDRFVEESKNRT